MHQLKSNCCSLIIFFFSVFTIIQQEELMVWHLSGVTRTRILVIGLNFSEFLSQEKERRFSVWVKFSFESAGNSSHATCHSAKLIPPFTLTVSKANCFPVYRKLIMWSTNAKGLENLLFLDRRYFNTFGFTFHVCQSSLSFWNQSSTCRRSIRRKTSNKQRLVGNFCLYIIK